MKNCSLVLLTSFILFCCKKSEIKKTTYSRPWKTSDISWQNFHGTCGTHSNEYKLLYKDTLINSDCFDMGYMNLENPLILNDSVMLLYKLAYTSGKVLLTKNGGYSWTQIAVGSNVFVGYHVVNEDLVYVISKSYITGIGKSNLSYYKWPSAKGIHYISDPAAAAATANDSTVIELNDSVTCVVRFY